MLDNELVSQARTSTSTRTPNGIDGRTGAQISGGFTIDSAQDLANFLRIGALPVKLELISQSQVSATLGQEALDQGLLAGLVGLAAVVLFLLAFYRVAGAIAVAALAVYAVYFFALIKLIPITMTLPGIAGPDPDDRRGRRRQHRDLRARQGGGARGQRDPARDRRRATRRASPRSSTPTSSRC